MKSPLVNGCKVDIDKPAENTAPVQKGLLTSSFAPQTARKHVGTIHGIPGQVTLFYKNLGRGFWHLFGSEFVDFDSWLK